MDPRLMWKMLFSDPCLWLSSPHLCPRCLLWFEDEVSHGRLCLNTGFSAGGSMWEVMGPLGGGALLKSLGFVILLSQFVVSVIPPHP